MPKKEKIKSHEPIVNLSASVAQSLKFTPLAKISFLVGVLVFAGTLGAAGYFYKQLSHLKANPTQVVADETNAVLAKVGKLIVLPADEQPTLATVTDPEKLRDQPFFASATKGDKVLIYANAKKAILYNPTENKIVEVAPINIGDEPLVSGTSDKDDSGQE